MGAEIGAGVGVSTDLASVLPLAGDESDLTFFLFCLGGSCVDC